MEGRGEGERKGLTVLTLMWLYLIAVNTEREAGVHGTQFAQETVITDSLSVLLAILQLLLALCKAGCDHWHHWQHW